MKICQIIYTYPPYILGGADIHAYNASIELAKGPNELVIITTTPFKGWHSLSPHLIIENNIKIYSYYPLNIYFWLNSNSKPAYLKILWHMLDIWNIHSYLTIKKILKMENPDIIHIHTPIGISLAAFSAAKCAKKPIVFTVHDYLTLCRRILLLNKDNQFCDEPSIICKLYRRFSKHIIDSSIQAIIFPSKFVSDLFDNVGFFKGSKRVIIPLGINCAKQQNKKKNININVVYIGGVTKQKGVNILINAFKKINNENIKLHIVGKGSDEEEFKEISSNDSRIIFHGFLTNENLSEIYRLSNIMVMPSLCIETFGLSIIESFNYGTPVICSDIGAYTSLVKDGVNGFLFKPGDEKQLTELLKAVITDTCLLGKLESGAAESACAFDQKKSIEKLNDLYTCLIKSYQDKK